jgi:hypothetical protein
VGELTKVVLALDVFLAVDLPQTPTLYGDEFVGVGHDLVPGDDIL